jgi:hypothetical protein
MPAKYEAIKRKFMRDGMSEKEAATRAARIYNAQRKRGQKPVTRGYHKS